jgi:post-segregation antitoxin (ccd killing protein)
MPKNILPNTYYWIPMPSPKLTKITLTIPAEQRNWLKDHPEIDISKLLQQTIRNQMMKDARKL